MPAEADRPDILRRWLRANAVFSALSAAALVLLSGSLPAVLGVGVGWVHAAIGVALALYAAHLWRLAGRGVERVEGLAVVVGDVLWVVGSLALVASGTLSSAGVWIVTGVALVIAVFAVMQWLGLRSRPLEGIPTIT
ncbi:MAG: hypothetical protein R3326_01490 [Gemmatimonadota bacterium]|nr:hypothetical protein [Gemmatimonadota bacterium]